MEKNIGDTDAYLRIACGLTMFGFGVMDRSRPLVALGAMKVAEGITRWCPLLHVLGMTTANIEETRPGKRWHRRRALDGSSSFLA